MMSRWWNKQCRFIFNLYQKLSTATKGFWNVQVSEQTDMGKQTVYINIKGGLDQISAKTRPLNLADIQPNSIKYFVYFFIFIWR